MKLPKLLVIFFILFLFLGGVLVFWLGKKGTNVVDQKQVPIITNPQNETQTPSGVKTTPTPIPPGILSLSSSISNLKIGQKVEITISLKAEGKSIIGSDVILKYDSALLRAETPIVESKFFDMYPRKTIDNKNGSVAITAFRSKDQSSLSGSEEVAKVTFTALKSGTPDISIDFVPGTTNHSTIVESRTSLNILGNVVPVTLTIAK